jgi:4-diphosphocytidyl-2-C-methyl-D-erythritol kinase
MPAITEIARAKVNLTLHVGAALSDGQFKGYHPLDSLVVFADFGDVLRFRTNHSPKCDYKGPFSNNFIDIGHGENSIIQALKLCGAADSHSVELEKNIPIAAGLGGGTADAAAVLRVFDKKQKVFATKIGADGPACRLSQTAFMRGIGEWVEPIIGLGQINAVLVNPLKAVSTAEIFKAFDREIRPKNPASNAMTGTLLERALAGTNDLQAIAKRIEPSIGEVLAALEKTENCKLARMSGSGATCFGLYETTDAAKDAERDIQTHYPNWWVRACKLGDPK